MKSENRIEEEIDAVRDKLCAETARMSLPERMAYFRTLADKARNELAQAAVPDVVFGHVGIGERGTVKGGAKVSAYNG